MKRLLTIAFILLLVSPALHALTTSCDMFQRSSPSAKLDQVSFDRSTMQYQQASKNVYQTWCGSQPMDAASRAQAVDSFAAAYAAARFAEAPGIRIQQRMGLQMLAVIAMTHELPARLRSDVRLREAWMQDCQDSCFSHLNDEGTFEDRTRAEYERVLRDEVLDHLQAAPGVVEIKRMLWDASTASAN